MSNKLFVKAFKILNTTNEILGGKNEQTKEKYR
jgi:hypothetical protein